MRKHLTISLLAAALATVGTFTATDLNAQTSFGAELVFANDLDLGVGLRVIRDIDAFSDDEDSVLQQLRGIGEFVYYIDPFSGCDACSAWEADINGAIPIDLGEADVYAGAGLNVTRFSVDTGVDLPGFGFSASSTEIGLNILGGLNFDLGQLGAFAEAGLQLGGGEQFTIKGGFTFGGGE